MNLKNLPDGGNLSHNCGALQSVAGAARRVETNKRKCVWSCGTFPPPSSRRPIRSHINSIKHKDAHTHAHEEVKCENTANAVNKIEIAETPKTQAYLRRAMPTYIYAAFSLLAVEQESAATVRT